MGQVNNCSIYGTCTSFHFFSNFIHVIYSFKLDLANLVNIAAIKAAVEGAEKLAAAQLEFAKDRIIMGTERKTMSISEESKKVSVQYVYYEI